MVLSTSADRTARLWTLNSSSSSSSSSAASFSSSGKSGSNGGAGSSSSHAALCFTHVKQGVTRARDQLDASSGGGSGSSSVRSGSGKPNSNTANPNPPFSAEVKHGEFFYMDRFALLAAGGNLYMYAFHLDAKANQANDLKRLAGVGRYKQVHEWCGPTHLGGPVTVSSFSCCNAALSHLIVCAASNRSVHLLDASNGSVARVILDAHAKPVHSVALPTPSSYVALDSAHYDVFLTNACDGVCALWDIRADRCAARFREHANRRGTSLGAAFSPCMRYVACGSEDKGRATLYDLRTSRAVSPPVGSSSSSSSSSGQSRLQVTPHTDCVPCVAFNPLWPQLASASYDGSIRFFTSEV